MNVGENEDIIYDFYNFPAHYYEQQYPSKGSTALAESVLSLIQKAGLTPVPTKRGLDHGIWVPFKIAFPPQSLPLDIPIVTVSLFGTEALDVHFKLGRALAPLRSQGVAIVGGGMSLHNMRDYQMARQSGQATGSAYGPEFHDLLRQVLMSDGGKERSLKLDELMKLPVARKAHPTFEHFMPLAVCLGAAEAEKADITLDYVDRAAGNSMGYMAVEFGM